jgi:hypothetical protein
MGLFGFGKRKAGEEPVSARERARLEKLVCDDLRRRGYAAQVVGGRVRLRRGDSQAELGLDNLALMLADVPPPRWAAVVAAHLDNCFAGDAAHDDLDARRGDFDAVKDQLVLQLWPLTQAAQAGDRVVSRMLLDDLPAVLVFDTPSNIVALNRDWLAPWGKSEDELFTLAAQQVRAVSQPKETRTAIGEGLEIVVLLEDPYAATWVLHPDEHPGLVGPHGVLMAIPARDMLVAHPVTDQRAVGALQVLVKLALDAYQGSAYNLSHNVYWYHEGRHHTIHVQPQNDGIAVSDADPLFEHLMALEEE